MNVYVYISEQCKTDAYALGFSAEVEKLGEKIEADQTTSGLIRHPRPFLVKKFGKKGRLIIEEKFYGGDCLICFLRMCLRSDPFYFNYFLGNSGQFLLDNTPQESEWLPYLLLRKKEPLPQLPTLSDAETSYLFSLDTANYRDEGVILESKEWVERMQVPEMKNYRSHYWGLLFQLIDNQADSTRTDIQSEKRNILFRYFPEYKKWFLLAPINPSDPEDELKLRQEYSVVFDTENLIAEEQLLRLSRRSYPALVVYDDEVWINRTQESKGANMALSYEEVQILDNIILSAYNSNEAYPLFINGRPGSGKSTVLQYLFAEHLSFHLGLEPEKRLQNDPLYLTYNESLLKQAKDIIENILRCDSKKVLSGKILEVDSRETRIIFDNCFGHFHEYLYSLISEEEKGYFDRERYVNFTKFRRLWNEKYSKSPDAEIRRLSPELAWHVIRTFIKGMRQETSDYFDSESYQYELPRDQKTVTVGVYEKVYQLWENWYKPLCEKDGFWDDQDLTRKILDQGIDLSRHPVIFCDESQDFTQIELELIFRLSLFSNRQVPTHLLRQIPFAFAGDPFQTLNPTGFNWEATQAIFHDSIVRQLDKAQTAKLQFNFKELGFNYRSTKNIVQLCNLIQLLRGIAFNIRGLYPQNTWFTEAASMPVYFDYQEPTCQSFLKEQTELVIIVPCQEGEELEYVKADPFLREIALSNDEKEIVRNVQSPIRAKGLQFLRVVLYKFGQQCSQEYPQLISKLESKSENDLSRDESLPLEYFVNRLYVGASRAQRRLFIVDTPVGLEQFWKFAKDIDLQTILNSYPDSVYWSIEDLIKIQHGNRDNWLSDRDDPKILAEQFLSDGEEKGDVYQLNLAKQNFIAAEEFDNAEYCQALIFEIEGKLIDAGDLYKRLNRGDKARILYWKAQSFESILALGEYDSDQLGTLEHRAASFLTGNRTVNECDKFLHTFFSQLNENEDIRRRLVTDRLWGSVFEKLVQTLSEADQELLDITDWKRIFTELEYIREIGVALPLSRELGLIAFRAEQFETALKIWNAQKFPVDKRPTWVIHALSMVEKYPNNLQWLVELKQLPRIIDEFDNHNQIQIQQREIDIIFDALLAENQISKAYDFLSKYPSELRYGKLLSTVIAQGSTDQVKQLAVSIFKYFVDNADWNNAIKFAEDVKLQSTSKEIQKQFQTYTWDETWRHAELIKLLSFSKKLSDEPSREAKNTVSKYLNRQLIQSNQNIRKYVTVSHAGAAIERANLIIDALKFYEAVIAGQWGKKPEDMHLARQRWLVCKRRQINITSSEKAKSRAKVELEDKLNEWNLKIEQIEKLPEFPDVIRDEEIISESPIKKAVTADNKQQEMDTEKPVGILSKVEIRLAVNDDVFLCKLSRKRRKLEIRNVDTEDLVIAYGEKCELISSDLEEDEILKEPSTGNEVKWKIRNWSLYCVFKNIQENMFITIEEEKSGVELITIGL